VFSDVSPKIVASGMDLNTHFRPTAVDIRNNAAHGKYSEYTEDEVNLMIKGIKNFLATYSA